MRPTTSIRPVGAPPTADPVPLAALRLRRSLAWPVGQAEALLSPAVSPPEAGAKLQIGGAADGDQVQPLFTGRVLRRQTGHWGSRLLIEEATGPLARLHLEKAVQSSTAAKLISELCQEAEVQAMVEPPGATLPSCALHASASALEQILRLALLSGLLVRTDVEGRLRAQIALPTPTATLGHQAAVISYQATDRDDPAAKVRVTGDGAMGAKGPGAESWLLASLDSVAAGEAGRTLHLPGLKMAADVTKAAAALAMRQKESRREIRLTLAGIPPADLGDVILLTGFGPSPEPARLVGITLLWEAGAGLLSHLELNGIGV